MTIIEVYNDDDDDIDLFGYGLYMAFLCFCRAHEIA